MVFTPNKQRCLVLPQTFHAFWDQLQAALEHPRPGRHRWGWLHLSLPLPNLDPLEAMVQLNGFSQPHFYWEHPRAGLAIAAGGSALTAEFSGPERFRQAQDFVRSHRSRRISLGDPDDWTDNWTGDWMGDSARFFCSFTFFDQVAAGSPFPPATLLLPRWQVIHRRTTALATREDLPSPSDNLGASTRLGANLPLTAGGHLCLEDVAQLWQTYQQLDCLKTDALGSSRRNRWLETAPETAPETTTNCTAEERQGDRFEAAVQAILTAIDQGQLHKAVLAHTTQVRASQPFSPAVALSILRSRHPDCYNFSVGRGEGAVFLGASPERLLQVRQRHLYTEALAGSAPRGATPALDVQLAQTLRTSPKELHEHRLVAEFIQQKLRALGLNPVQAELPQVLQLTGIQHLRTPIHCPLPPSIHPLEVVAQLHPTPAVAGVPQQAACRHIQQLEGFERSLYAAPLGWIDSQGNSEFCVGIRSALLTGCQAQLFAGAGVVSGSVPQQERAEIELKLETLRSALAREESSGPKSC